MTKSKGWDWEKANQEPWLKPTDDCFYLSSKWLEKGYTKLVDLGAGLGRHSVYFAKQGFEVDALDVSEYALDHISEWAEKDSVEVNTILCDIMGTLPYPDQSVDCVFAYHAISHTDTAGIKNLISELERVIKPGGEIYTSLCSKEGWEFSKAGYEIIDQNTVLVDEDGPEKNVPHFFANRDDILKLFQNFNIERIRHIDYCYLNSKELDCKYYYVNGIRK